MFVLEDKSRALVPIPKNNALGAVIKFSDLVKARSHSQDQDRGQNTEGYQTTASFGMTNSVPSGGGSSINVGGLVTGINLDPLLWEVAPEQLDEEQFPYQLMRMYRDIYYFDSVAGATVDTYSSLPFSNWTLSGMEDKKLAKFEESLQRLNIEQLLPALTHDYLVQGAFLGTMFWNKQDKLFTDIMCMMPEHCKFTQLPLFGQEPVIEYTTPDKVKRALALKSSRIEATVERMGSAFSSKLKKGKFELSPLTTLFIPRTTSTNRIGCSWLKRILPIYLVEKNLWKGTMIESTRRIRSILHLMVGDTEWEPTMDQIAGYGDLFRSADADPLGAIVATRSGVNTQELRCLTGDTLVSTDKGLIRLDKMVKHDPKSMAPGTRFDTKILVKNNEGRFANVESWWYQGKKRVQTLTTESGYSLTGTKNHKLVTITDGSFAEIKFGDVRLGETWALIERSGTSHSGVLKLPKFHSKTLTRKDNAHITIPTRMTKDLALFLGQIVADSYINNAGITVSQSNRNKKVLTRYCRVVKSLFNVDLTRTPYLSGHSKIKGRTYSTQSGEGTTFNSRLVVEFLESLGIKRAKELREKHGDSPSKFRTVPKCIMKANRECQLAFLKAFIDADGCIGRGSKYSEINLYSSSAMMLRDLRLLLVNLGFLTKSYEDRLTLTAAESARIVREMGWFAKRRKEQANVFVKAKKLGIPSTLIVSELEKRDCGRHGPKNDRYSLFLNDDGRYVRMRDNWKGLFYHFKYAASPNYPDSRSYFSYEKAESGDYEDQLDFIRKVSKRLYRTIIQLVKWKPKFERVISRKLGGKQHVYDLTMDAENGAPVFVANGLLTRNSGGDFWSIMNVWSDTVPAKLRALGISESFLAGDATLQNMETSISVFLDGLRQYRHNITNKVFYSRIFPIISLSNGYTKNGKKVPRELRDLKNEKLPIETFLRALQSTDSLDMPQLRWTKTLEPEGDEAAMTLLEKMEEKGVPIPIRAWAAAGGVDLNEIISESGEDRITRAKLAKMKIDLAKYVQQQTGQKPEAGNGEGEGGGESEELPEFEGEFSTKVNNAIRRRQTKNSGVLRFSTGASTDRMKIGDRDYGQLAEARIRSKTGKWVALSDAQQRRVQKQANEKIIKALKNLKRKR